MNQVVMLLTVRANCPVSVLALLLLLIIQMCAKYFSCLTVHPKLGLLSESSGVAVDKHKFLNPTRDLLNWEGIRKIFFSQSDPQVIWVMSPIMEQQISNDGTGSLKKACLILPRGKSSLQPNPAPRFCCMSL